MRIEIGYPDAAAEKEILKRYTNGNHSQYKVAPVLSPEEVCSLQAESRKIHMDEEAVDYLLEIVNRTRSHPEIELGVSPRGTVALFRAAQALALVESRDFVLPDDVKRLVNAVFAHRLVIARTGTRSRTDARTILKEILDQIPV